MDKAAIIMAGGVGARLWPRSFEELPKQFEHYVGTGTLLQNSVDRLKPYFVDEEIFVVTLRKYADIVREQLPNLKPENLLLEPQRKNTAAALAFASVSISDRINPDTIIFAFPADHEIVGRPEFHKSLDTAKKTAETIDGAIVTIGVEPTRPEPGFGYVQVDEENREKLGDLFDLGVRKSTAFAEKPDVETAARFLDSGDFLWNSGIFAMKDGTLKENYREYLKDDFQLFDKAFFRIGKEDFRSEMENTYKKILNISFDYSILERSDKVYVVTSDFAWSDVGNWDEVYRLSLKDGGDNFSEGPVISIKNSGCYISARNKPVATLGLKDTVVVESERAILICPRGMTDDVSEIVEKLKKNKINLNLLERFE